MDGQFRIDRGAVAGPPKASLLLLIDRSGRRSRRTGNVYGIAFVGHAMDLETALAWAADRKNAVLITIRGDGRPQSSDISYTVGPLGQFGAADDVAANTGFTISVTGGRAKTANMRRDNRVVVHVTDPASWSYVSFDGTVSLTDASADPADATTEALVAYYEAVAGKPHPDWDEYRAAMVSEGRLLVHFTPASAVGQIN